MNLARCLQLARSAIAALDLDLAGSIVLTEAATGNYALTAPLAALAGAEHILALGRDSRYGSARQAEEACGLVAKAWGVADRLTFLADRADPRIGTAHVITNLGALRPLDREFLSHLGPLAAVPLMWETWEFRPEDLDLAECRRLGIPVLGTDESHQELHIFNYVGLSATKLLLAAGVEVFRSRIALVGSSGFSPFIQSTLRALGAEVTALPGGGEPLPPGLDAVVVAEHRRRDMALGPQTLTALAHDSPGAVIVHVCGGVDWEAARRLGISHVPDTVAPVGYMSVTADFAGPRAVIDLHAAGLKVGQEMVAARESGLHGLDAELAVLERCSLAQGFADRHPSAQTKLQTDEGDS